MQHRAVQSLRPLFRQLYLLLGQDCLHSETYLSADVQLTLDIDSAPKRLCEDKRILESNANPRRGIIQFLCALQVSDVILEHLEQRLLLLLRHANATVDYFCLQVGRRVIHASLNELNRDRDGSFLPIELDCIDHYVVQDLFINGLVQPELARHVRQHLDAKFNLALLNLDLERFKHFFNALLESQAGSDLKIKLVALGLYLNLAQLRLDAELKYFARAPNDLQELSVLRADFFVILHDLGHVDD